MNAAADDTDAPSPLPVDDRLASIPFLVVNPNSANGSTGRKWASLEREAAQIFGQIAVGVTAGPMDAVRLTRQALEAGHRTVLAVGGDGTLNEVVNGFFRDDGKPLAPGASVGILPRGTGSDFRRTVDVPVRWGEACRHVANATPHPVDVGRVTFVDHEGRPATRYFINIASFGVSGAVVNATHDIGKGLGGRLTYKLSTIKAMAGYRDAMVDLSVDDGPSERVPVTALAVGNGAFFGGGMKVAPGARLDDGQFACTLWNNFKLMDFVLRQRSIYSGEHVTWTRTRCFPAARLRADSSDRVLLELDGEQPGVLPAVFELVPGGIGLRA